MRGKRVPQRMRRDFLRDPSPPHRYAQSLHDSVVMHMMPPPHLAARILAHTLRWKYPLPLPALPARSSSKLKSFIILPQSILFNHRGHREHGGTFQTETKNLHGLPRLLPNCNSSFSTPLSPCPPWLVSAQSRPIKQTPHLLPRQHYWQSRRPLARNASTFSSGLLSTSPKNDRGLHFTR